MTYDALIAALAKQLRTIDNLVVYAGMPDTIADHDVAVIIPAAPLVLESAEHASRYFVHLRVVLLVQRATSVEMQQVLAEYFWPTGNRSIVAAVEANRTLDRTIDVAQFTGVSNWGATGERMQVDVNFRCMVSA